VKELPANPTCVIVKHGNPCGVAEGATLLEAYLPRLRDRSRIGVGGIIAFNRSLDSGTAMAIVERQFVEVIVAPEVRRKAASRRRPKKNVRLLVSGQGRIRVETSP